MMGIYYMYALLYMNIAACVVTGLVQCSCPTEDVAVGVEIFSY